MNKHNLIRLGAFAQEHYGLQDGFKIMELASDDHYNKVRIALPKPLYYREYRSPLEFDEIDLDAWGSMDNQEIAYVGYSALANVLVIRVPK